MKIETDIWHLQELPLYATEKPYTIRYIPNGAIPATNVERESKLVAIEDMRGKENTFTLDKHGFTVATVPTKMQYNDYNDQEQIVQVYLSEVRDMLEGLFFDSEIDFVSYLIRKREAHFPLSTGRQYEFGQPNIVAHVDATSDDLKRQIRRRHPERAEDMLRRRNQYITIWRPLKGPLYDWPLALCDGHSVDLENDLEPQDIVDNDQVLENAHVYYRPSHRWYYLNGQTETEALVFRQADTYNSKYGTPHCAIENPVAPEGSMPRESIEVVAFICSKD